MAGHRPARVADAIHQELAKILRFEIKDPRAQGATVSRVEVSSDLSHARVFVSVFGGEQDRDEAVRALERASGFVRRALAPSLRLRAVPELRFELDRGAEHSVRISDLLEELAAERDGKDPSDATPTDSIDEPSDER